MKLEVAAVFFFFFGFFFLIRVTNDRLYGKELLVRFTMHTFCELCHQADTGDVYDGVFLCCPFSHIMSWMRSWS